MYILVRKEDLPDMEYVKGSYGKEAYCKYNRHLIYDEEIKINKGEFVAFRQRYEVGEDICRFCTRLGIPEYVFEGTYTRYPLNQLSRVVW